MPVYVLGLSCHICLASQLENGDRDLSEQSGLERRHILLQQESSAIQYRRVVDRPNRDKKINY